MSARSCAILVEGNKIQDVERVSWLFEVLDKKGDVIQFEGYH